MQPGHKYNAFLCDHRIGIEKGKRKYCGIDGEHINSPVCIM